MEELIAYVLANKIDLIAALLAFLGFASIVAKLTPNTSDNKIVDVLLKIVQTIGLNK